jgi:MFS family permease
VGGEWGGAVTLAVEHAPPGQRGRYAAFPQLGSPVGTLVSSGAFALVLLLPAEAFDSWGWRLPFLAAFPLLFVAVYIRRKVEESPLFKEMSAAGDEAKVPALEVLKHARTSVVIGVAATLLGVGGYYMLTTFAISYGVSVLGLSRDLMVNATVVASAVEIVVIVAMGYACDRIGAGRVTFWGGVACAMLAVPIFLAIQSREPILVVLAIAIGIGATSITYAVSGALLTQLFPTRLRYSGVALSYNLAGALAGFMPLLATVTLGVSESSPWGPAALLIALSLVTAIGGALGQRSELRLRWGKADSGPTDDLRLA